MIKTERKKQNIIAYMNKFNHQLAVQFTNTSMENVTTDFEKDMIY